MQPDEKERIRKVVRQYYGQSAQAKASCCECGVDEARKSALKGFKRFGYSPDKVDKFFENSNVGLCCGNPLAIAGLKEGETVLDLGSGRGLDCYLAAEQVGASGHIIGVDMTPEVVSRARENVANMGLKNLEIRLGEIENLPVADESVDAIISNCVVNLSPDKPRVFEEAFRVLKPGGRLAISDIVATSPLPEDIRAGENAWAGCIAGALLIQELKEMLQKTGFEDVRIQPKDESREIIEGWMPGRNVEDFVVSATIEAKKPRRPR